MHAVIHTDGGARGNPGPAGIGVVIEYDEKKKAYKKYIGKTTNNQAEYQAVILALEKAKQLKITSIDLYMDSELIVNQLNHNYKIKDVELGALFVKVWNLSVHFKKIKYIHVRRSDNRDADTLVNQAIDEGLNV